MVASIFKHVNCHFISLMSVPKQSLTRKPTRTSHSFILKVRWIRCKYRHHNQHWLHWLVALVWDKSRSQLIRDTILPFSLGKAISSPLLRGYLQLGCFAVAYHAMGMVLQTVQYIREELMWSMHLPLLQPLLSPIQACHHSGPAFAPQKRFYLSCFILTSTQLTLWSNFMLKSFFECNLKLSW